MSGVLLSCLWQRKIKPVSVPAFMPIPLMRKKSDMTELAGCALERAPISEYRRLPQTQSVGSRCSFTSNIGLATTGLPRFWLGMWKKSDILLRFVHIQSEAP